MVYVILVIIPTLVLMFMYLLFCDIIKLPSPKINKTICLGILSNDLSIEAVMKQDIAVVAYNNVIKTIPSKDKI